MTNKEDLEKILDSLVSRKSRQTFFEAAINNGRLPYGDVPDKYVDEVLDIPRKDWEDSKKQKHLPSMAEFAEHSGRYDKAAHFYKQLNRIPEAVTCARKAGRDDLEKEWADEYIKAAEIEAPKNTGTDKIDNRAIEAASRAAELGLKERADKIVRNYVEQFSHVEEDPEGHEARANFARQYATRELAERFYAKAMHQFEEIGKYDCALRVARTLEHPEKIQFYDNLRFLVADPDRRAQIAQDRADDADGREFER